MADSIYILYLCIYGLPWKRQVLWDNKSNDSTKWEGKCCLDKKKEGMGAAKSETWHHEKMQFKLICTPQCTLISDTLFQN